MAKMFIKMLGSGNIHLYQQKCISVICLNTNLKAFSCLQNYEQLKANPS